MMTSPSARPLDPMAEESGSLTRPQPSPRREGTAIVVGALVSGAVIRLALMLGPAGFLNSDEAFTGLIARSLGQGELFWIFPGQSYQGTLEGFIVAPLQVLLGPSALLLKLTSASIWLASAWMLELAGRRIAATRPGVVFALVWLWSSSMVLLSSMSLVGYGSGLALCSVGWWAWSQGALKGQAWPWMLMAGAGFGAAVWQQPTFLPTAVVVGLATLLVPAARALRSVGALGVGMLIGVLPLVAFNAADDWSGLDVPQQPGDFSYADRVRVTLTQLLPRMTGIRLRRDDWTFGSVVAVGTALVLVAAFMWFAAHEWSSSPMARPLILLAPLNVLGIAAFSTSWYTVDARYAISFVPVLAIILGTVVTKIVDGRRPVVLGAALTGLVLATTVVPLWREDYLSSAPPNADIDDLVSEINRLGFRCALGDYWSTHRLDYLADGQVRASAEPPYVVRLPELYESISSAPGRYVRLAPIGSETDARYSAESGASWTRREVSGTAVFVPTVAGPTVDDAVC